MNTICKGFSALNISNGVIRRHVQTNADLLSNCTELINRNPRNLELMRIAQKPYGYYLESKKVRYYNKLNIILTKKHLEAQICHFKNGPVVTVSTKEWAIKKQLYRFLDMAAFANVGKILAQRCLESGIYFVYSDIDTSNSEKYATLLKEISNGGVELQEPKHYRNPNPWDKTRPIKPWTIVE